MKNLADILFRGRSSWLIPLFLLIFSIVLFEVTPLDTIIQDCFYTPGEGWIIKFSKRRGFGLVYYTFPKWLLGQLGFALGAAIAWFAIKKRKIAWRLIYILVTMITVPCIVANLKADSSMPYPAKLVRYGGNEQKRSLYESFFVPIPEGSKHYHGWPAGHASGGFAPIGIAFAPNRRRYRYWGFAAVTSLGFFMGICHTMDGNHFFSHNLVSYFIALLTAALFYQLFAKLKTLYEKHRHKREHETHSALVSQCD